MTQRQLSPDLDQFIHPTSRLNQVFTRPSELPTDPSHATLSYWLATTPESQLPPPSTELPVESDVIIIGSGITGVSCAYHLAHIFPQNATITIVEARQFCSGATGRNGGHLTAVSALAYTELSSNPHHLLRNASSSSDSTSSSRSQAVAGVVAQIMAFEAETRDAIHRLILDNNAREEVGYSDRRNWHLCFEPDERIIFDDALDLAKKAGLDSFVHQVRRVPIEEVQAKLHGASAIDSVFEIPGGTLHPRSLVCLFYRLAAEKAKQRNLLLTVATNTRVHSVYRDSSSGKYGTSVLKTSRGELRARYVVHATNGYASHLLPHLAGADGIVPARGQLAAIEPQANHVDWPMGISAGHGYEYGHQRPKSDCSPECSTCDSKLPLFVLGGGRERVPGREWGVSDDSILNPQVSDFLRHWLWRWNPLQFTKRAKMEWTGIMGFTRSMDPLVGLVSESASGLQANYIAAGYSGHGMTRAYGCAQAIADMIVAEETGEKWLPRPNFPRCYLTQEALAD